MLLILILNRVGDRIPPFWTPCSCSKVSDNVEPIRTLKDLSDKKFDIKFGIRPLRPISCKSFMMPYFHIVSYAFSRSKNIATQCSFLINASRIKDSNRTKWSLIPYFIRKPACFPEITLFDSRNQTSLSLIILSIVLHIQLVNAIGL